MAIFRVTLMLITKVIMIRMKHYLLKNILIKSIKDIINNLKKSNMGKILLKIAINFVSSKDNDEGWVMHSKSNKIEIMIRDRADEIIEKFFSITYFLVSNWTGNINKR